MQSRCSRAALLNWNQHKPDEKGSQTIFMTVPAPQDAEGSDSGVQLPLAHTMPGVIQVLLLEGPSTCLLVAIDGGKASWRGTSSAELHLCRSSTSAPTAVHVSLRHRLGCDCDNCSCLCPGAWCLYPFVVDVSALKPRAEGQGDS